jgi:hypothetical protein
MQERRSSFWGGTLLSCYTTISYAKNNIIDTEQLQKSDHHKDLVIYLTVRCITYVHAVPKEPAYKKKIGNLTSQVKLPIFID